MQSKPASTVVVIPTYNELENLENIVARVLKAAASESVSALIVDDNSPDGTGKLADRLAAANPLIEVLHRQSKAGLGAAYIDAFTRLLERPEVKLIVQMDADGSHNPEDLPRMIAAMQKTDLVIGSRWVPGGKVLNWPRPRQLLSRGGSTYARILLGIEIRDATAGYRIWQSSALRQLNLGEISSRGYCFQVNMLWQAVQRGLRIREIPVTFVDRTQGKSKMSAKIIFEAVYRITLWGIGNLPQRIFRSKKRSR